jgi:hypothetical protein
MRTKYKFGNNTGAYFISFSTTYWIDVFTRDLYFAIMTESLYHLLICFSPIFFCHIERSRDAAMVLDCARTDNRTNL